MSQRKPQKRWISDAHLECFEQGPWGRKYPAIIRSWRASRERVIPFFAFSEPIRKVIYTTNAIESLHRGLRKSLKARGHFPNDKAASKLLYLALRNIETKWQAPVAGWRQALNQFYILFSERLQGVT